MSALVYLPLLVPVLAAAAARPLAARLEPRLATWLLTATTVALAAFSTAALALMAASALARSPLLAALGDYSQPVLRRGDPVPEAVLGGAGRRRDASAGAERQPVYPRLGSAPGSLGRRRRAPHHAGSWLHSSPAFGVLPAFSRMGLLHATPCRCGGQSLLACSGR